MASDTPHDDGPVSAALPGTVALATGQAETLSASGALDVTAPHRPVPGFTFRRLLGRGGQAVVYEVKSDVGQTLALKMPNPICADAEARKRFRLEAEAMARLRHPHLVELFAWGEHDGWPYFTMPVYAGGTLRGRLKEFRDNPRLAAALLAKVADAIHYLHTHGAIHRDIKPSNVLLDEQGEPYVSDFGLVKVLADSSDLSIAPAHDTVSRDIKGTPAYMGPEQAGGANQTVGPPWDVWSLGVMLYEVFTGQLPYLSQDVDELRRLICTVDPPRPRSLKPDLDAGRDDRRHDEYEGQVQAAQSWRRGRRSSGPKRGAGSTHEKGR